VSFIGTAVITFIAILVGYLSESLPDASLSDLDRALLFKISQWSQSLWPENSLLRTTVRQATATASAIIGFNRSTEGDEDIDLKARLERARNRRSKGLERFILALSDQQLVTGLAVLIAGYINLCTRSVYHFRIIVALAWFSSTTHLSTLAVLRVYLTDHPKIRDWRVVAMLAVLGLLAVAQFTSFIGADASMPSGCLFQSFGGSNFSNSSDSTTSILDSTANSSIATLNLLSIAQLLLIIIFLAASYSNRICRLYSRDPDWAAQNWLVDTVTEKLGWGSRFHNIERIIIASSQRSRTEQGTILRSIRDRRRLANHLNSLMTKRPGHLAQMLSKISFIDQEIGNTFLSELLTLTFGVTYGIAQVVVAREAVPTSGLVGDQNAMGFGQLVPLLLMALPVLAAGEIYFGKSCF